MSSKDNIEKDFLAESLKSRLENFEVPVDDQCWSEIEQRMQKKRRIIPFWLWSAIGGAAALAILFISLLPYTGSIKEENIADKIEKQIENTILNSEKAGNEIEKNQKNTLEVPVSQQKNIASAISVKTIKKTRSLNETDNSENGKNNLSYTEKLSNDIEEIDAQITKNKISAEKNIISETQNEKTQIANNNTDKSNQGTTLNENSKLQSLNKPENQQKKYERPKRKTGRPLLAAAFGSSGGVELKTSNFVDAAPVYENLADIKTTYSRILAPNEFQSITDLPPLSFGLKISKEFAPGWSMESGLIYTYLATIYREPIYGDTDADMNLHYLGIPLNLKCNISKNKKWAIYLSGGVMMEKGLRSIYNQYIISGNYTYKTVAKTDIEGFQYSINGATGFSYDIFNDISVYAEPSITWYFDNNQPRSARTQQPLVVGLNAGLRFKL